MTNIQRSLCWVASMLMVVLAKKYGVFDAQAADTLLLVLPIVAIMSLRNQRTCSLLSKKEV